VSILLSSGQIDATQRRTLQGVVYLLSGTTTNGSPFRWSNHQFDQIVGEVPFHELNHWEEYLALPRTIERALAARLGERQPIHPIAIPVRNKLWRDDLPLLAHLVDGTEEFDGSTATLFVAYLKPGQEPAELAYEDFTPVLSDGKLGAPQDLQLDGFTLQLLPASERRVGKASLTRAVLNPVTGGTDAVGGYAMDPRDEGKPLPYVVGAPYQWLPTIRVTGPYGYVVSGVASGATSIRIGNLASKRTSGSHLANWLADFNDGPVLIHRAQGFDVSASYSGDDSEFIDITCDPLPFEVPQGAIVQSAPSDLTGTMSFYLCSPGLNTSLVGDPGPMELAWMKSDGSVIPISDSLPRTLHTVDLANARSYSFHAIVRTEVATPAEKAQGCWLLEPDLVASGGGSAEAEVTVQPEYTNSKIATLTNYPDDSDSDGSDDGESARDGALETHTTIIDTESLTLFFPSVTDFDPDFANDDTTRSFLNIALSRVAGGSGTVRVQAGDFEVLLTPPSGPSSDPIQFKLPAPTGFGKPDFDQQVVVTALSGDGQIRIHECWWDHTLMTVVSAQRTVDTEVAGGGGTEVVINRPPKMVDARLVWRPKHNRGNYAAELTANIPWLSDDPDLTDAFISSPPTAFAAMMNFFHNRTVFQGIDEASYTAAEVAYSGLAIRANFALTEDIDWDQFEADFGVQFRCHTFEGVRGHEMHVLEDAATYDAMEPEYTFRLPGLPDANCVQAQGAQLFERLATSELFNFMEVEWEQAYVGPNAGRFEQKFSVTATSNVEIKHPGGLQQFWMHAQPKRPGSFSAESAVESIAQWYVDRQGRMQLRFSFDTGWVAYGLDRGSIVRVVFSVGPGLVRHLMCEVEDYHNSPINAERVTLTCRGVGTVQQGDPDAAIITWEDAFAPGMTWQDLFNPGDSWDDHFEVA
jgi:hypothetical protein